MSEGPTQFIKKRAPTLYVIIAMKLLKAISLLLLAVGVYKLSDDNLPEVFRGFLKFWHLDPERKFFVELADKVDKLTEQGMVRLAWGTVLYSLFSLVEGVGLIFRVPWAGWLAIGESAFFIPVEIIELMHHPTGVILFILAINIFIVWYLFQNRSWLFRHHHH